MLKWILLLAGLISVSGCITSADSNQQATVSHDTVTVVVHDTVKIPFHDTAYLVDRPKLSGESDPAIIKRVSVLSSLAVYVYIDTVTNASGYKLYVSLKPDQDFVQYTTATFFAMAQKTYLAIEPVPDHNGYFYYQFSSLFVGKSVFFRVKSVSKSGIESKFSNYMAAVIN